jgi:hypothetical protein
MITKKDPIARGKAYNQSNPYNLTQKQLDELEVTKAQVAEHLKNVDFSKHTQSNPTEAELQAARVLTFSTLLNPKRRWNNLK